MNSKILTHVLNCRRQSPGLLLALAFVSLAFGWLSLGSAHGASFEFTGSMTSPRQDHTATLLRNGQVLVAGGWGGTNNLSSAELFDPASGIWSVTGAMGFPRTDHTATLLPSGRVMVTGGWSLTSLAEWSSEVYDPATGLWSAIAPMASKRAQHTATLLASGQVLVTGGTDGTNELSTAELYDPFSGTWSAAAAMTWPRDNHTATLLPNGQVLIVGGGRFTAEVYDPIAGTWTATANLSAPRWLHTATLMPSGRVLVAGGLFLGPLGSLSIRDAELYDPATGTWADTAPMGHGRFWHAATLLTSGLVLVTGGFESSPFSAEWTLAISELYDPGLGNWREAETMRASRDNHSATMLASGEVLIAGGRSYDFQTDELLSSAELYRPSADTNSVPAPPTLINGSTLTNGSFQFQFLSGPSASFTVLATPHASLPLSDWTVLGGVTESAPGLYEFTDVNAPNFRQRYYRVRCP